MNYLSLASFMSLATLWLLAPWVSRYQAQASVLNLKLSGTDEKLLYRISLSILAGTTFISALFLFKVIG